MKKILLFADWYEPGFKAGGPIRSCVNFAENMKDTYEVFIFTTDRDLGDTSSYPDIECDKWISSNGISILYASPGYLTLKNIKTNIQKIAPDYIYSNSMYSRYTTLYPLLLKCLNLTDSKFVLAPRGMLKKTALQFKETKKKLFLSLFKLLGIHKKIIFHLTDITETKDVQEIFGEKVKYSLVPNFPPFQKPVMHSIEKQSGALKIIFTGRIHPIKNLYLLLNYVKTLRCNILLTIVGTIEDKNYWNECQRLIKSFSSNIEVILKKDVPNTEIEHLIADHHIFALPTRGENFGHAIFESLMIGRPVLISDQTPWKNLKVIKAGWDLPLNNPDAFINVIKEVAEMDNETFDLWCKGAWQLANDYITKSDLKNQYLNLFS